MKTKYTLLIFVIVCLILNSCAVAPSKHIPEHFSANEPYGLIVGTIAIKDERPRYNGYFLHYSEENEKGISQKKMITIRTEQPFLKIKFKPDFFDEEKAVYYYAIKEPIGKYSFRTMKLFTNLGHIQSMKFVSVDVPFISVPGKITYVGQIELDYGGQVIKLVDKSERDLPNLKEKYPNIDWKQLINVEP